MTIHRYQFAKQLFFFFKIYLLIIFVKKKLGKENQKLISKISF